jgi:hypothetical protein
MFAAEIFGTQTPAEAIDQLRQEPGWRAGSLDFSISGFRISAC